MKRMPTICRWRRAFLPALAALCLIGGLARAADLGTPPGQSAKSTTKFAPPLEAKLTEATQKITEAKRQAWNIRMKVEIEDIQSTFAPDANALKLLRDAADKAVGLSAESFFRKLDSDWRKEANRWPQDILNRLNGALLQLSVGVIDQEAVRVTVDPFEQAVWTDALDHGLSPDQALAWKKSVAERRAAILLDLAASLGAGRQRMESQFQESFERKARVVKFALAPVSKEHEAEVDALAKMAFDQSLKRWQSRAEKQMLAMNAPQRQQIRQEGFFSVEDDPDEASKQMSDWNEGLSKILSVDELAKLAGIEEALQQRRIPVLARALIDSLDEALSLTARQRELLQPIAERAVKETPSVGSREVAFERIDLTNQPLDAALKALNASEADLSAVLDARQRKRWQELCHPVPEMANDVATKRAGAGSPANSPEPASIDRVVADRVEVLTAPWRDSVRASWMAKAEVAAIAAQLDAAAFGRLQTAARGAADRSMDQWQSSVRQMLRNRLGDVTPGNVEQRLAEVERQVGFGSPPNGNADSSLLENALKAELSAEQQATWKKELEARKAYSTDTARLWCAIEFNRIAPLNPEQQAKLQDLVSWFIDEYAPDMQGWYVFGDGTWYQRSYLEFLPVAGLPEKDLKAILTEEQWARWTTSSECEMVTNYWTNVQRRHDRRVKPITQ